jgi:hypothetical protein
VAIRAAGTVTLSCVDENDVGVRTDPPKLTVEVETKLVPFTVRVNCGPPAVAQVGLSELMVGTGLLIVNVTAFDVPPAGVGLTTVT